MTLHGGYIPAIIATYPDIGLDAMKFPRVAGIFPNLKIELPTTYLSSFLSFIYR